MVDADGVHEQTYWTPTLTTDAAPDPRAFRARFERAVQRRLVADVPVGICLSGGLDSSSICTVMAQQLRDHVPDTESLGNRLKTFSIVYDGDPIDERAYMDAGVLAEVTGADNSTAEPTDQDFIRELEAWVWHMEEPMVSSAPFAMWMVMRLAQPKVTVLLDGQGGDELLAGYDHYPYVLLRQLLRERKVSQFTREAWASRDVLKPLVKRRLADRRHSLPIKPLLRPALYDGLEPPKFDERVAGRPEAPTRLQDLPHVLRLPPLLRYEDRNSMAHSIESRLPFLDQELVDYILTLPRRAIIHNGWTRAILREGLRGVLTEKVRTRRKKIGFTTPEFRWYRRQRAVLQSLMRSPSFRARPYWKAAAVAENFRRACAGEVEESMFFWRAVNAEVWLRVDIDGKTRALDNRAATRAASFAVATRRLLASERCAGGRGVARRRAAQLGPAPVPRGQGTDLGALPAAINAHQAGRRSPARSIADSLERLRQGRRRAGRGRGRPAGQREGTGDQPGALVPDR